MNLIEQLNSNFFMCKIIISHILKVVSAFAPQKSFNIFHVLLFGVFLCVFDHIYL